MIKPTVKTGLSTPRSSSLPKFHQLLQDARTGEPEPLGVLLESQQDYLISLATSRMDRRLRRRLSPGDIVQEALLAAHRDFQAFRGDTHAEFRCWVRTILINVLHRSFDRHVKVRKRDLRREVSIHDLVQGSDGSALLGAPILASRVPSPSALLRQKETRADLARRLANLREDHRQVITLRTIQGLPFSEVAKRMKRSNGAARMLWLRAVDAFRTQFSEAELERPENRH